MDISDVFPLSREPLDQQYRVESFLELFDAQVELRPEAVATMYRGQTLSYAELWSRSVQFAKKLIDNGIMPGQIVAVAVGRHTNLLPVLIGIMRAGAVYTPIDFDHPQKSIAAILDASKPSLIVFDNNSRTSLRTFFEAKTLAIDLSEIDWASDTGIDVKDITSKCTRTNRLAYIIYTSGSTGTPKGVCVSHSALARFLLAIANDIGCDETYRVAATTTITFDISCLEIFLPLALGGTVIIFSHEVARDATALSGEIEKYGVDFFQATPSTFRMLLSSKWSPKIPVKKILCGGEELDSKLAKSLLSNTKELWNMYGPTETTIWSTAKLISDASEEITIGRPISGSFCTILDENQEPVPVGSSGELYIGGMGVADGYYLDEIGTNERFKDISGPDRIAVRVYKTGDKAAINKNGELIFLGRLDFQVKVLGHRVELPSIESMALKHESVASFAAIAAPTSIGEMGIYGFYTARDGKKSVAPKDLRAFLKELMPAYMLPSQITQLDSLPVNLNGKIDRKALKARCTNVEATEVAFKIAQETLPDFDSAIYEVWCDVLRIDEFDFEESFFDLGGNSLSAFIVSIEIEQKTGKKIPLSLFFENPVFKNFVQSARTQIGGHVSTLMRLNSSAKKEDGAYQVFFISGIHLYQDVASRLSKDYEAYAIYVEDERKFLTDDREELTPTSELAEFYVEQIYRNKTEKKMILCGISFGGILALEIASQLQKKGVFVDTVFMLDSFLPGSYRRNILLNFLVTLVKRARSLYRKLVLFSFSSKFVQKYISSKLEHQSYLYKQNKKLSEAIRQTDLSKIEYERKIVVVRAEEVSDLGPWISIEEDLGWAAALGRPVLSTSAKGDHLGILKGSNGDNIAKLIELHSN